MSNINGVAPNLGFQVALSKFKVAPTAADILGDIASVSGVGFEVESVDATPVSSTTGYAISAPTLKKGKAFTVNVYKKNANYAKVHSQFHDNKVTSDGFYCSVTLIYPKVEGVNDLIPDYSYHGYISALDQGDADVKEVQKFSFQFTPVEDPSELATPITA